MVFLSCSWVKFALSNWNVSLLIPPREALCPKIFSATSSGSPTNKAPVLPFCAENPAGHRWIAVSRDLEKLGYTFGASVCIEGISREFDGDWTVQDRMNKRFTKRIDFLVNVGTMGKWNNIKIELNE